MLAYDYPLLGFFWSMMIFFFWIIWIMLLFRIIGDIFRSHDMGGFAKTLWTLFVIFLPFLGVLVYVMARGNQMSEHAMQDAQAQQNAFNSMVRDAAGPSSTADELAKLAELNAKGVITAEEFAASKAKLLEA